MNLIPIFDGHNDTLLKLYRQRQEGGPGFFDRSDRGHIDLPRAREGGFGGGFFAVFVPPERPANANHSAAPPPPIDLGYAQRVTLTMAAQLFRIEVESGGQVKVVRTVDEIVSSLEAGVLAAILHFEGAEAIDPDLDALEVFYRAGLRSLGSAPDRPNIFAQGVPFGF